MQVVYQRLARSVHVRVRIDDRGHHGHAGQIHAGRACRYRYLAGRANRDEAAIINGKRAVFDGRRAVAYYDACPLVQDHGLRLYDWFYRWFYSCLFRGLPTCREQEQGRRQRQSGGAPVMRVGSYSMH